MTRAARPAGLAVALLLGLWGHAGAALAQSPAPGTAAAAATAPGVPQKPPRTLGAHPRVPSVIDRSRALLYVDGTPLTSEASGPVTPALVAEGHALYATHCSSCHGADLGGVPARATTLAAGGTGGPSLRDAGGSAVDFYLTTGRMPLAVTDTQAVHDAPHFDARQIAAIDAFVDAHATVVPVPPVRLDPALLQRGRMLFEDNCESCHGASAEGATAGYQWVALPLDQATPTQIAEAIRVGPGVMPRWNAGHFSDRDVSAIATYVRYLVTTPADYGGSQLGDLGPVAEGLVGGILGVGSLFWVIYFTGTKADGRRLDER